MGGSVHAGDWKGVCAAPTCRSRAQRCAPNRPRGSAERRLSDSNHLDGPETRFGLDGRKPPDIRPMPEVHFLGFRSRPTSGAVVGPRAGLSARADMGAGPAVELSGIACPHMRTTSDKLAAIVRISGERAGRPTASSAIRGLEWMGRGSAEPEANYSVSISGSAGTGLGPTCWACVPSSHPPMEPGPGVHRGGPGGT